MTALGKPSLAHLWLEMELLGVLEASLNEYEKNLTYPYPEEGENINAVRRELERAKARLIEQQREWDSSAAGKEDDIPF